MRTASNGKYNVIGVDKVTGKIIYPFYDGFNTKKEAAEMADTMDSMDNKHFYVMVKNK